MTFDAVAAARTELARREAARRHLLPFITTFLPNYSAGWVHKDICTRLEAFSEAVARKESPRLMLFMPPRAGKSEIASRNFPAWHLGRHPDHEIIATSYASALAIKFSRKARAIAQAPEYQQIFPEATIDPDAQSLENWIMTAGGGYMAAGVGGPITGSGAHILLIDDPLKNDEEAQSETTRQAQKDWYTSTAYTRLAPGGGVLVIMTRWHHDDLSGWLMAEMAEASDQWEVVSYPAIAEEDERYRRKGEALHPERYPLERLEQIKRVMMMSQPRHWYALYQQRPTAEEGDYFTRDMIHTYEPWEQPALADLMLYAAWDLAIGIKETNDWTVGLIVGIDREETVWVLDRVRGRWDGMDIVERICDTHQHWRPYITGIEKGQISMALGPFLDKRIQERGLWDLHYEPLPPGRRDKLARARPIQGRMKQGKVRLPKDAVWFHELQEELLRFPNGLNDDQVDALAWVGQMMAQFGTQPLPHQPKGKSWKDQLDQLLRPRRAGRAAMTA